MITRALRRLRPRCAQPGAIAPAMLATRILTAVVLVPLVLAALFMLPPLGWGAVSLGAIVVAAASSGRDLAGYRKQTWLACSSSARC